MKLFECKCPNCGSTNFDVDYMGCQWYEDNTMHFQITCDQCDEETDITFKNGVIDDEVEDE